MTTGYYGMSRHYRKQDAVCDLPVRIGLTKTENETTLSFYKQSDYEAFKTNPEEKWM
jgi:hypothetical protein